MPDEYGIHSVIIYVIFIFIILSRECATLHLPWAEDVRSVYASLQGVISQVHKWNNALSVELVLKKYGYVVPFCMILLQWNDTSSLNFPGRSHLVYIVNSMAGDDLGMQSQGISHNAVPAHQGLCQCYLYFYFTDLFCYFCCPIFSTHCCLSITRVLVNIVACSFLMPLIWI